MGLILANDEIAYRPPQYFAGYDPAKIADGSGFVIIQRLEDEVLELKMVLNLKGVDYTEQVNEIVRICKERGIVRIAIDSNGVGDAVYDMLHKYLGGRVMAVPLRRQMKELITMDLRVKFQDKKVRLGRNFKLYRTLRKELHELDPKKLDHPPKGSSDLYWGLALAVYASKFDYIQAKRLFVPIMER